MTSAELHFGIGLMNSRQGTLLNVLSERDTPDTPWKVKGEITRDNMCPMSLPYTQEPERNKTRRSKTDNSVVEA